MVRGDELSQNSQSLPIDDDEQLTVPTRDQIRSQRGRTQARFAHTTAPTQNTRQTNRTQNSRRPNARTQYSSSCQTNQQRSLPPFNPNPRRKTQPPVNDFENVDVLGKDLPHESSYTSRGGFSGRAYRKSRAKMPKLQRNLKYGQYLEIPKGQKSIFQSPEMRRRNRFIRLTALVIALLVIAIAVWILVH